MNILPKKRWHVRNQDNKERVRRDEENARLEQKKEEERILLAEQEARITLLRKKSGNIKEYVEGREIANKRSEPERHLNLFSVEEEAGGQVIKENEEYKKEKQKEKEDYEKKIGLLTYVGQSSIESREKNERPWYLDQRKQKQDDSSDSEKEELKKSKLDPMSVVDSTLKQKNIRKHKKKKSKKKEETEKLCRTSSSGKLSIDELREKRLKRERLEREKTEKLLRNLSSADSSNSKGFLENDPTRYSNQFHPDIARKRSTHNRHKPY